MREVWPSSGVIRIVETLGNVRWELRTDYGGWPLTEDRAKELCAMAWIDVLRSDEARAIEMNYFAAGTDA